MKAFIPVVWPRVQSASSAAGVFLSTIFPYRSASGGWGVREEAAGLRRGERFAGERRPEIGEGFPKIGEPFPVFGEPFPKIGEHLPEIGELFPDLGEPFPNFGELFPKNGEPFPEIGRRFPKIGQPFPNFPEVLRVFPESRARGGRTLVGDDNPMRRRPAVPADCAGYRSGPGTSLPPSSNLFACRILRFPVTAPRLRVNLHQWTWRVRWRRSRRGCCGTAWGRPGTAAWPRRRRRRG